MLSIAFLKGQGPWISKFPFGRLRIVAISDTKMHTYLEIIHTVKFEVFGEGPYLNQI